MTRPLMPCLLLVIATLAGCVHPRAPDAIHWQQARQLVLVTTPGWNADHGSLRTYTRHGRGWREAGTAAPVMIGRAGAAWGLGLHAAQPGLQKREGDGRNPAGVFAIGTAFGYAGGARTALPYAPMQASHYCIDVDASPLYNRIVDAAVVGADAVAGSTEPMRRDLHVDGDQRYRLGLVIEHNPDNIASAGSCIFAHVWKSPTTPTSGCTAMDAAVMERLLAWLRPEARPIFVLLPEPEYARLHAAWQLPELEAQ